MQLLRLLLFVTCLLGDLTQRDPLLLALLLLLSE
jgi:hypothetical protein